MEKYRLKKEAVPFIKKDFSTKVYPLHEWERFNIDENALEKVEEAFLTYGHYMDKNSSSLCGWSSGDNDTDQKGSHFHFTINFPSAKYREHDEFTKGRCIRELMDSIQQEINEFYHLHFIEMMPITKTEK